jgi:hypothetical protein
MGILERILELTCAEQGEDDENVCWVPESPEDVVGQQEGIYDREDGRSRDGMNPKNVVGIVELAA